MNNPSKSKVFYISDKCKYTEAKWMGTDVWVWWYHTHMVTDPGPQQLRKAVLVITIVLVSNQKQYGVFPERCILLALFCSFVYLDQSNWPLHEVVNLPSWLNMRYQRWHYLRVFPFSLGFSCFSPFFSLVVPVFTCKYEKKVDDYEHTFLKQ